VQSSFVAESPPRTTEPPVKRRRVSISPDPEPVLDHDELPKPKDSALSELIEVEASQDYDDEVMHEEAFHRESSPTDQKSASKKSFAGQGATGARQPAFIRPPHFRTLEAGEVGPSMHPLPDAFSPRKHGAKYMPGGLAAELRGWLVGIKGSDEDARLGRSESRIVVDLVHQGAHLWTVQGHRHSEGPDAERVKLLLAGTGRLKGLAKPTPVKEGMTIIVAPPTWDVLLDGLGSWTVACDWYTEAS
jgi:hypothetical protein